MWCLLPQHPSKPITVHTVTKKLVKGLDFTGHPPHKTPDMRAICLEQPYIKGSVLSSLLSTCGPDKGQDEDIIIPSQPAPKHTGQCSNIIAKLTDNRPGIFSSDIPQLSPKTFSLDLVINHKAQLKCPKVDSMPRPEPVKHKCDRDSKLRYHARDLPGSPFSVARTSPPPYSLPPKK